MDQRPPYNAEAEEAVIGCYIVEQGLCGSVRLRPEDFWFDELADLFRAILSLVERGHAVDFLTIVDELRRLGLRQLPGQEVSIGRLVTLSGVPTSAANHDYYARFVEEDAIRRRMLAAGLKVQQMALDRELTIEATVDRCETEVAAVVDRDTQTSPRRIGQGLDERLADLQYRMQHGIQMTGITTGLPDLDWITSGLQPGNLMIVAARPSVGKTALATQMAVAAARAGHPALMFSLEMEQADIQNRILCSEARVNLQSYRGGTVAPDQLDAIRRAKRAIEDLPFWFLNPSTLTPLELRQHCRRRQRDGLGLVVVDYLGLMTTSRPAKDRNAEVTEISRSLKQAAQDLGVPIVLLSQLNREADKRSDKRPVLSDLRESGAIEQDADIVAMLYREDYYRRAEEPADPYGDDTYDPAGPQRTELLIRKNRQGPTGMCPLVFLPGYARFETQTKDDVPTYSDDDF